MKRPIFFTSFFVHVLKRVEILDLTSDTTRETAGIELRDPINAVLARANRRPAFLRAGTDRTQQPDPRDDYSSPHAYVTVLFPRLIAEETKLRPNYFFFASM
jgi:hypothetical protein